MKAKLHFFDVDHTITRHSTGLLFLYQGIRMGLLPVGPLITVPLLYWRYRIGKMDPRTIEQEIPSLRGLKREQIEQVAERCFQERIRKDIFREAEEQIRQLKEEGGEVVFATLSVDLIVKPLAEYLGVRDAVTSSFEFDGDACTGRLEGGPIFNLAKRDQVLQFIAQSGREPEECSFYSDSINDLPLLEAVGTPVAVNPDRRLSEQALERGWQIRRWK